MKKMKWAGRYQIDEAVGDAGACFREQAKCLDEAARLESERLRYVLGVVWLKDNGTPEEIALWQSWYGEQLRRFDQEIAEVKEEAELWQLRARDAQADELAGFSC